MHGIIMNQLQRYVVAQLGRDGWRELTQAAGVERDTYSMGEVYPDQELVALVMSAVQNTGTPLHALLEDFGAFLAPALLRVYEPLIDSRWRTLDVIEHTEVEIDYRSERRLCSVAKGIASGMAAHFGERISLHETECMHRGGSRCLISVVLEEGSASA